jgi:predicted phage terminase large subunit-like protein
MARNLARTDLYFLLRFLLNRADVEHPWILARCIEVQQNPDGYIDLWARGHYKSSLITFGKTIQDILASHGDDPLSSWDGEEVTFGIFSHTRPIAKGFLRQIKHEFESNDWLRALFPDIVWKSPQAHAPKWSEDDGIILQRKSNPKEATVEAWGVVDGQPTSRHYTRMVYDDVVTVESVNSPEMIRKTTERWEISLNLMAEGGRRRAIGTRYHDEDTYQAMIDRGLATPRIHKATVDGTISGASVLLSEEEMDEKRKLTAYVFSCQMLLDPIPAETAHFKREWVQYYDEMPEHVNFWGGSDYAVTALGGDYTVHGVIAVDPAENIYFVDWWRKQTTTDVWVEQFLSMGKLWQTIIWGEEAGQINKSLGPFINKRMQERGDYFTREQFVPTSNKATRSQSFRGRMAMGKVFFPRGAVWVPDLISELVRFPVGAHDDQVDVCSLFGLMLDKLFGQYKPEPPRVTFGTGEMILNMIDASGEPKSRYG